MVLTAGGVSIESAAAGSSPVTDIEYGRNLNGKPLLLDAYPATAEGSPVIVSIHGGGWDKGDKAKSVARSTCTKAVARGYACFAPNYTLSGEARWPAQLDDLRQASTGCSRTLRRTAAILRDCTPGERRPAGTWR